jgi:hypothetical protein
MDTDDIKSTVDFFDIREENMKMCEYECIGDLVDMAIEVDMVEDESKNLVVITNEMRVDIGTKIQTCTRDIKKNANAVQGCLDTLFYLVSKNDKDYLGVTYFEQLADDIGFELLCFFCECSNNKDAATKVIFILMNLSDWEPAAPRLSRCFFSQHTNLLMQVALSAQKMRDLQIQTNLMKFFYKCMSANGRFINLFFSNLQCFTLIRKVYRGIVNNENRNVLDAKCVIWLAYIYGTMMNLLGQNEIVNQFWKQTHEEFLNLVLYNKNRDIIAPLFLIKQVLNHAPKTFEKIYKRWISVIQRALEILKQERTSPHVNMCAIQDQLADLFVLLSAQSEYFEAASENEIVSTLFKQGLGEFLTIVFDATSISVNLDVFERVCQGLAVIAERHSDLVKVLYNSDNFMNVVIGKLKNERLSSVCVANIMQFFIPYVESSKGNFVITNGDMLFRGLIKTLEYCYFNPSTSLNIVHDVVTFINVIFVEFDENVSGGFLNTELVEKLFDLAKMIHTTGERELPSYSKKLKEKELQLRNNQTINDQQRSFFYGKFKQRVERRRQSFINIVKRLRDLHQGLTVGLSKKQAQKNNNSFF